MDKNKKQSTRCMEGDPTCEEGGGEEVGGGGRERGGNITPRHNKWNVLHSESMKDGTGLTTTLKQIDVMWQTILKHLHLDKCNSTLSKEKGDVPILN